jgi:hypothetical protein
VGERGGIKKEITNSNDMKTRKIIVEVICFILLMNWFYEGIYKLAYWPNFSFYIKHAPLLKSVGQILAYAIPIGEIGLALMFLFSRQRVRALYLSIGTLIVFVLWVMSSCLFTRRIFWPYHALWAEPTWMQKMLISLGLCWMAFMSIILSSSKFSFKRFGTNSLRNAPVNAH